jgi:hypothetical protein
MSRNTFFASRPHRGGAFRPLLEVLESRFAPVSLFGTPQPLWSDLGGLPEVFQDSASEDTALAGTAASLWQAPSTTSSPGVSLENRLNPGSVAETLDLPMTGPGTPGQVSEHSASESAVPAGMASSQAQAATRTTSAVVEFANRSVVRGESTLTRTDHGITMHLTATGVPAGAYTGWIPIFNPGGTVPIAAGRVAGHVVGEGGNLNFAVHLNEGEIISGHPVFPSGSVQDARGQDIGMVVRYHGPAEPGRTFEQTHTFEPSRATDFLFTIHRVS